MEGSDDSDLWRVEINYMSRSECAEKECCGNYEGKTEISNVVVGKKELYYAKPRGSHVSRTI